MCMRVRFQRDGRPRVRSSRCATTYGARSSRASTEWDEAHGRHVRGRASARRRASSSRTGSRPGATARRRRSPRGSGQACASPSRTTAAQLHRAPARAAGGGVVDLPAHVRRLRSAASCWSAVSASSDVAYRADPGPSALGDDPRRFWHLTLTLARTDFKLRFFGSVARLLLVARCGRCCSSASSTSSSREVVRLGDGVQHYPSSCSAASMLYFFYGEATGGRDDARSSTARRCCARCASRGWSIPLSVALTALFNLALNFVVLASSSLLRRRRPRWTLAASCRSRSLLLGVLATGIGMLLVGALRALPRHQADLGGLPADRCSTRRRSSTRSRSCRRSPSASPT